METWDTLDGKELNGPTMSVVECHTSAVVDFLGQCDWREGEKDCVD
jgi:hypothetical protein